MYARLELRTVPGTQNRAVVTAEGSAALLDFLVRSVEHNGTAFFYPQSALMQRQHRLRGLLVRNNGTAVFPVYRLFGVMAEAGYALVASAMCDACEVHTFHAADRAPPPPTPPPSPAASGALRGS